MFTSYNFYVPKYISNMKETPESIISFWFGPEQDSQKISDQKSPLWWSKNDQIDMEIANRFKQLTSDISRNEYPQWQRTPLGLLASIICLDQFPRNIYRGEATAFSFDRQALAMANSMVSKQWDQQLPHVYSVFSYLPFEHSEALADQEKSLSLYAALRDKVSDDEREMFEGFFQFAVKHYEIVERFGRFPHRNDILGRASTKEEQEFLSQPGSSF